MKPTGSPETASRPRREPGGSRQNVCRRWASGVSPHARSPNCAHIRPARRARRPVGRAIVARGRCGAKAMRQDQSKAVNQRSKTNKYQARRNSLLTGRFNMPRSINRRTASCNSCGWRLSHWCTGSPKPDLGRFKCWGGNRGSISWRTRSLPRRCRSSTSSFGSTLSMNSTRR